MTDNAENYPTEAEKKAYYDGLREGTEDFYELEQVRKIACALVKAGTVERGANYDERVAGVAWTIWRAIKAGQEGKP